MFQGTTILAVRRNGKVVVAGDGQVSFGQTVLKHTARKVRKLYHDRVIAGFAGATADAFTLFENTLVISGSGDVVEPDDGAIAIGSGGNYALAAARVLIKHTQMDARAIVEEAMRTAASICVYTNEELTFEELP